MGRRRGISGCLHRYACTDVDGRVLVPSKKARKGEDACAFSLYGEAAGETSVLSLDGDCALWTKHSAGDFFA